MIHLKTMNYKKIKIINNKINRFCQKLVGSRNSIFSYYIMFVYSNFITNCDFFTFNFTKFQLYPIFWYKKKWRFLKFYASHSTVKPMYLICPKPKKNIY